MRRTQIYLSETQQQRLGVLAKERRTTASALIREAVDGYLASESSPDERLAALRALGKRFAQKPQTGQDSEALVDALRRADLDRLKFRE